MLIYIVNLMLYFITVSAYDPGPGVPIPQAEELDDLLVKFMRTNHLSHGTASDFLLGINANESDTSADLDVNVLDMATLRRIIHAATKQTIQKNYRRYEKEEVVLLNPNKDIEKKCFDLMKGSVYAARYRLQDTNKYREMFSSDPSYNIAIYIATIQQLLLKMENLYAMMNSLKLKTHFLWRLIIYEKILACNVDITYSVQRVFVLNDQFKEIMDEMQQFDDMNLNMTDINIPPGMEMPPGMEEPPEY